MSEKLYPRKPVPSLTVPLLSGETWNLSEAHCKNFFLLVFYRGYHCPVCKPYLMELKSLLKEFEARGVTSLALSSDTQERAQLTYDNWNLDPLTLGYNVSIETGREWGLYVSTSRGKTSAGILEPEKFTEPGLFLLRPDKTLYASIIHTMPFARPSFAALIKSLDFILEKDYPARGEA